MMATSQGVKFKFAEGEKVLCYEPDLTKARVLYDSKVLEVCVTKDSKKRKSVEYLIHFSGWSNTWDRCVSEEFILKDNEENRNLQMKLAAAAAVHLRSKKRCRLPEMFRESLNQQKNAELEDDWKVSGDSNASHSAASSTLTGSEEEEVEETKMVELDLPSGLRKQLEDDYFKIKRNNKLVKLPCEQNVIEILESFVNTHSINLFHTSGKSKGSMKHLTAERNSNLCKEVMHGLRIYFDFTLPLILLYDEEKVQFDFFMKNYKPKQKEVDKSERSSQDNMASTFWQNTVEEPCGTGSLSTEAGNSTLCLAGKTHKDSPLSPSNESSSQVLRPGSKTLKRERHEDILELDCPKRILRSSINRQDMTVKSSLSGSQAENISLSISDGDEYSKQLLTSGSKEDPTGRMSKIQNIRTTHEVKSTSHSRGSSPLQGVPLSSPSSSSHFNDTSQSRQVEPSEQIQIYNHASSLSSSHSLSDTSTPPVRRNVRRKKDPKIMTKLGSWCMIPPFVYDQSPPPPSLIYGPHHLLRLFVKLPELIHRTYMPDCKLNVLLRHLEAFLRYLDVHREDLFLPSAYEDAVKFIDQSPQDCIKEVPTESDIQR